MKFKATKNGWQQVPKPKKIKENPEMVYMSKIGGHIITARKTPFNYWEINRPSWSNNWETFELEYSHYETTTIDRLPNKIICLGPL